MDKRLPNILIVAESIDINDSSASKGRVALIQNLHKAGFQVKVYHYTRKEIQLPNIEYISIKEQKGTFNYFLSKGLLFLKRIFKINSVHYFERKVGFSYTFLNDSKSIQKALENENPLKYDWILTLSKAASFRTHHAVLHLPQWHIKWLAYVHDPFPFHCYPKPYDWFMPGYKQKEAFFKEVSLKARYAIFPSKLLMEWMGGFFPAFLEKGVVIPHQILENENQAQLPSYFEGNKFTLLHAGNLMKPRDPSALVTAFERFLANHPDAQENVQLLFLGNPSCFKELLMKKQKDIPQFYLSDGYVSFEQVYAMQMHASVNIILEAKAVSSPFLPGKFPHCVKADKPILLLGPAHSECRRLLGEEYPYWAEIDDTDKILAHITKLYNQWIANKETLALNRKDLEFYMGHENIREIFSTSILAK